MSAALEGAGSFATTGILIGSAFLALCDDLEFQSTVFTHENLPFVHRMTR